MPSEGAEAAEEVHAKLSDAERLMPAILFQSEVIGGGGKPEETMQLTTDCAWHITAASGAAIVLAEGDHMVQRALSGTGLAGPGGRSGRASSLAGHAVETGDVAICDDSELDPRVDADAFRRAGLRSMVCVPLVQAGEAVGVLEVVSSRPAAFDSTDVAALRLLGGVVVATMSQADLLRQLDTLAHADPLTELSNRRGFVNEAQRRLDLTRRKLVGSVLVMIDLDHFKNFNDRHGHPEGDRLLQDCATRWTTALRKHDILGRWGGEEFVMLLTDCTAADALAVCERMRTLTPAGQTFSAGVVVDDLTSPLESLIARADDALYDAKRSGRNRTVIDSDTNAA